MSAALRRQQQQEEEEDSTYARLGCSSDNESVMVSVDDDHS